MIKRLHLTTFKGISDTVEIEFKPITLLFGPNSAGKSTIIQALHYLKEIFERKNFDPINTQTGGKAIDLGGFRSLVNDHDLKKEIELKLTLESESYDVDTATFLSVVKKDFDSEINYDDTTFELYDQFIGSIISSTDTFFFKVKIALHPVINKAFVKEFEFGINDLPILAITESRHTGSIIYYRISYINFDHPVLLSTFSEESIDFYKNTFHNVHLNADEFGNVDIEVTNLFTAIPEWEGDFKFKDEFLNSVLWQTENGREALRFLEIIKTVINNFGKSLSKELQKIRYLGPIREVPSRDYTKHHYSEEERWSSGLAAWDSVYEGYPHIETINKWLDKLNTGYRLELRNYKEVFYENIETDIQEEINLNRTYGQILELFDTFSGDLDSNKDKIIREINQILLQLENRTSFSNEFDKLPPKSRLYLIDKSTGVEVLPFDVGIGISQVFPVIIACLMQSSSILAIEQPELHIHPAMQVELADLFISQTNRRDFICLIETHSEHIMLRVLRRIEESTERLRENQYDRFKIDDRDIKHLFTDEKYQENFYCAADKLKVYWFESFKKGIELHSLPVDDSGEFTVQWPRGFFEERAEELFPDE